MTDPLSPFCNLKLVLYRCESVGGRLAEVEYLGITGLDVRNGSAQFKSHRKFLSLTFFYLKRQ